MSTPWPSLSLSVARAAWPIWTLALDERPPGISDCESPRADTADHRPLPRLWPASGSYQPRGLWWKSASRAGTSAKAATEQANHVGPSRLDLRYEGVIPLRFRRDLDRPVPARRTRVRLAARGPTDEHRPRA